MRTPTEVGVGAAPVLEVHCEFRRIGSLFLPHGRPPIYAQLYTVEFHEALDHRIRRHSDMGPEMMYCSLNLCPQTNT